MRRLYNAVCSLIESKADHLTARAEYTRKPDETPEPQREGAYSIAERSGNYEPDELHADQYRIGFTSAKEPYPPTPSGDSLLTETYRRLEL